MASKQVHGDSWSHRQHHRLGQQQLPHPLLVTSTLLPLQLRGAAPGPQARQQAGARAFFWRQLMALTLYRKI
jgi:hypothetical protein